ncbi:telomerase reverse transcriptase isoform X2 [Clupea harengus]|uniref:Telomerase reverse transcriptase n=1 Tax=Clupea harengus TaxID=7950 RepID=A0A6P8H3W4_CLUHA|nr:telomerase reverse transcriptase isoform X2 [Clupea harengus]
MSVPGLSRVLDILRSLYPTVQTIEDYVDGVALSNGRKAALVEEADTSRFKSLLRGLIVCVEKQMRDAPSGDQLSTLPEVLAYVLNNMNKNKSRNVLRFGYLFSDKDGDADPFKFHGVITQSPAFIHSSDLWKKINQRLGTDLTQHLLRNCAVFAVAPPTCLFQVCGVPLYDLISMHVSPRFLLCKSATQSVPANPQRKRHARPPRRNKVHPREVSRKRKRKREDGGEVAGDDEGLPRKQRCCQAMEKTCDSPVLSHNTNITDSEQTSNHNNNTTQAVSIFRRPKVATGTAQASSTSHGSFSWKPANQPLPRPSECFIRMLRVLYSRTGIRGFLLNRKLTCGSNGPRSLQGPDVVRLVFLQGEAYLSGEEPKPKRLPRRFFNMAPLFSRLLRNHRKCPYAHFLHKKCSLANQPSDMVSLLTAHCRPYRVYLFVRECLLYVVPEELWGSDQNRMLFLARVKQLLRLGKFESLSLAQVMWSMKVRDCGWLGLKAGAHCPSEHRYRERLLGQFLAWLLESYVLGLVKAMFYVTESMGQKHALRFYRREVWNKLQTLAFREHLSKGQWKTLTSQEVASLPKTTVTARLRFIPKAHGMRPITRLVGADPVTKRFQRSVKNLRDVLGVCVKSSPALLGSTVWGRQDIHRVLKTTALQQKIKPTPLYFVKVDVSGAYDSLPHDMLVRVVSEVLSPVQDVGFSIRHYAKVWRESLQGLRKQFCTRAGAQVCINMKGFVMEEQEHGELHNAILVENYNSPDVKGRDVLEFFKQMLTTCVVRFGKRMFRQVCGIPQGSVVSSLLCNLCYAHMENSLLSHITEKGGCLMRLVDDFLLITPKLNKAMYFLKTLSAGVPRYGCVVNPQKVAVNFPLEEGVSFPGVRVLPQHCLFPWCGLLLDTQTLDVYNDYSSYAGLSLRYSLTLGSTHSPASFMERKLMAILRLKCDAILLDLGAFISSSDKLPGDGV